MKLNKQNLTQLAPEVKLPAYAIASTSQGIAHIGVGGFHRAHQALYIHELRQKGDTRWSITGGNLRPDMADTVAALQAQGGAYTLETVTPQGERSYTRIESIQRVIPYQDDLLDLIAVGAEPATRIISFTVTEAGYYLDAKNRLDLFSRETRPGWTAWGNQVERDLYSPNDPSSATAATKRPD